MKRRNLLGVLLVIFGMQLPAKEQGPEEPRFLRQTADCPVGTIVLTNQDDVDGFVANYGSCTEIDGDLDIYDLTDLSFLSNLTTIRGELFIYDIPALTSLEGLHNLTLVEGDLALYNLGISGLDDLGQLEVIGGNFALEALSSLTSLEGLSSLTTVGGTVHIVYNSALSSCALQPICEKLSISPDAVNFDGNAPGCYSPAQVKAACGVTSCMGGDAYIGSQEEVAEFLADYGTCTEISGDLTISGVTDLTFLSNITAIQGSLIITDSPGLLTLSGLDNLTSVGGELWLFDLGISDLGALGQLASVGGELSLYNLGISDVDGLEQLTTIGGGLSFYDLGVANLDGLGQLTTIGGGLSIELLPALTTLGGLASLVSIGDFINVVSNASLGFCTLDAVCEKLADDPDVIFFNNNAAGCLDTDQVAASCDTPDPSGCPAGDVMLYNQEDIDNYIFNHGSCTEITGDLFIGPFPDLTDLSFLSNVTTVGGRLIIRGCPALTSLEGLHNLTFVGSFMALRELGITNLEGLRSLTQITYELTLEKLPYLTSLTGLSALTSLGTGFLNIFDNPMLSECAIEAVCQKLSGPAFWIYITNNATGCATAGEVSEACNALPVTLLRFDIATEGQVARLDWTTTFEKNSKQFEIQHSPDAETWQPIGAVAAGGDHATALDYHFTDSTPREGVNYYRLKMIDLDGSYSYSPIKSVEFKTSPIVVFPNPAADRIYIRSGYGQAIVTVSLVDLTGKTIYETPYVSGEGIPVPGLHKGVYIVKVHYADNTTFVRSVVLSGR